MEGPGDSRTAGVEAGPLTYVVGGLVAVLVLVLLLGAITGRLRLGSCCAVADPARDLRMRAAFEDDDTRS